MVWAGALATLVLCGAAAKEKPFDPYKVPRERFDATIQTIALAPIRVPDAVEDEAAVTAEIEKSVGEQLERKGYEVVASSEYAAVWDKTARQVGGVFDPLTGETDKAKFDLVRDLTARELARRYSADAILFSWIATGAAFPYGDVQGRFVIDNDVLEWDGRAMVTWRDERPQLIVAPYLNIALQDLGGADLYGIRRPLGWSTIYTEGRYQERPWREAYLRPGRIDWVVTALLEQLVVRPNAPQRNESPTPTPEPTPTRIRR